MLLSKVLTESSFDTKRLESLMDRFINTQDRSILPAIDELKKSIASKNADLLFKLKAELKSAFPNSKIEPVENGVTIYFDDKYTSFKLVPDVDIVKIYYPNKRRMHSEVGADDVIRTLKNELNSSEPLQ